MPVYAYKCRDCGSPLEAHQEFSDAALTVCPVCGGVLRKQYGSIGVTFNGSGFYRTDSRAGTGDGGSGDGGKSDGAKSDGGSKSESSSSGSGDGGGAKADGAKSGGPKSDGGSKPSSPSTATASSSAS